MEADLPAHAIDNGRFTLVLEDPAASWTTASRIAQIINEQADTKEELATAIDAKNIVVTIPQTSRQHPDQFLSTVLQLPVLILPTEARVSINTRSGTLVVSGDVEISPVVISQKSLTISTLDPKPVPRPTAPIAGTKEFIPLDTTQQGGAKLQDLAVAFDQLKVPIEDRLAIIRDLHRSGHLHAKLIINGVEQ